MGLSTWGWGTSCGGLITSGGWGECPCPDFIPGIDIEDLCAIDIRTCVDERPRPGDIALRLRPDDIALRDRPSDVASRSVGDVGSRDRPDDIPSRSRICED